MVVAVHCWPAHQSTEYSVFFVFSDFFCFPCSSLMVFATHCWPALESTEDVIFISTFVFFCFIFYLIFLISYFSFSILHFLLFFLCRFLMVVATHCWPAHRSTEASDTLWGAASALTVFGRRPTLSHFQYFQCTSPNVPTLYTHFWNILSIFPMPLSQPLALISWNILSMFPIY